jgi:hypothetical protein
MYPGNQRFQNFRSSMLLLCPPCHTVHFVFSFRAAAAFAPNAATHACASLPSAPSTPSPAGHDPRRPSRSLISRRPRARRRLPHPQPPPACPTQLTLDAVVPHGPRSVLLSPSSATTGPPHARASIHGPHGPATRH